MVDILCSEEPSNLLNVPEIRQRASNNFCIDFVLNAQKNADSRGVLENLGLSPVKYYSQKPDANKLRAICPKCRAMRSLVYDRKNNQLYCANIRCRLQGKGVIDLIVNSLGSPTKELVYLGFLCDKLIILSTE